jgi:hypothetical protein
MTKKAQDLKPGDVLDKLHKTVRRTYIEQAEGVVYVLFEGFEWYVFDCDMQVHVKPHMVKAKDVKRGMTVRNCAVGRFEVMRVAVDAEDDRVCLLGHERVGKRNWICVHPNDELEVVE